MKTTMKLSEIKRGNTFSIAGMEFIKFDDKNGQTIAVNKDILFRSAFGKDNNFAQSEILKKLENNILPKISAEIGEENICEFETDLVSLDGSKKHGKIRSKVSLPTFDFYRNNVEIFDKYNPDCWWWLATPDTTSDHLSDDWIVCVSPLGDFDFNIYYYNYGGVRPFWIFVSSISVSCEE